MAAILDSDSSGTGLRTLEFCNKHLWIVFYKAGAIQSKLCSGYVLNVDIDGGHLKNWSPYWILGG